MVSTKSTSWLNPATFWKIWIGFFLFLLINIFTIILIQQRTSDNISRRDLDNSMISRAKELSSMIEHHYLFQQIDELNKLKNLLPSNVSDTEDLVIHWLEQHSNIIYISIKIKDKSTPTWWSQKSITINSAYNHFRDVKDPTSPWFIGQSLSKSVLGYPIISIGISPENHNSIDAMEMKIRLNNFNNVVDNALSADENIIVMERSGEILFSSQENAEIPDMHKDFTHVLWEDQNAILFTKLQNLPWHIYLIKKVNPLISTNTQLWKFLSFIGAAGLLLSLLFSVIWSKWIDKPILELTENATEIARGDFTISIPLNKNMLINRLIKIFNYMAEEMDRFKQLDVSEIINEKNKNEAILRNIADGVVVTDNQDRILIINTVAEKWFGLEEEKTVQKPIHEYIKNTTLVSLLQEVKDGQIQCSTEFEFKIQETREKKVFQAHAARIQNMEEKLIGVVTVIRDVTKEKEADRIKTELVSMVAHELKSPLTSIYGFSELLLDSNPEDINAREYAQVILTESTRLTDLVNKFLDLSRLEAGRTEIKKSPFDFRQVVEKIVSTYKGQAEKKNIRIITEIPENIALAMGDQDMIEQVILNLFSNAVKYSPKHSKIGIESKEDGDNLVISVIDNGYGITKEALSHIFDKFYRVIDSEGSEDVEGSGLGLALAREIIEQHEGTITVTSRLGVGSVFTFTLPKASVTDVK